MKVMKLRGRLPSIRTILHINFWLFMWYICLVVFVNNNKEEVDMEQVMLDLREINSKIHPEQEAMDQEAAEQLNSNIGMEDVKPDQSRVGVDLVETNEDSANQGGQQLDYNLLMVEHEENESSREEYPEGGDGDLLPIKDNSNPFLMVNEPEDAVGDHLPRDPEDLEAYVNSDERFEPPPPEMPQQPALLKSPKVEIPQVDSPKVESPQVDSPQVDNPQVGIPQVDSPKNITVAQKGKAPKKPAPKKLKKKGKSANSLVSKDLEYDKSALYNVNMEKEFDMAVDGSPTNYLKNHRNPCWLSKLSTTNPYLGTPFEKSGGRERATFKVMRQHYEQLNATMGAGALTRLRCLPLVYLIGVTKSGTTDLYEKLALHPMIFGGSNKEPTYWNQRRLSKNPHGQFSDYLNLYDYAAKQIGDKHYIDTNYHPAMTIDGSPNSLWNFDGWWSIPGNQDLLEPKFIMAHTIRRLVPEAKIIVILREPADRLYSQYRMWSANLTSEVFHDLSERSVKFMEDCVTKYSLRTCVYNKTRDLEKTNSGYQRSFKGRGLYLRASMYYPFLADWLEVFPRDQVLAIRGEDYYSQRTTTLNKIYNFLGLNSLSDEELEKIEESRIANTLEKHKKRSHEPMLDKTKQMLNNFFMPYNQKLATLLSDTRFLWQDGS